ncbi:Inner membrane protein YhaI [compost metagenome]
MILLPTIGVAIRRMHDVDKSGWHILIPFYNLYLFCKEGTAGMNQYGADPKNQLEELDEIGKE